MWNYAYLGIDMPCRNITQGWYELLDAMDGTVTYRTISHVYVDHMEDAPPYYMADPCRRIHPNVVVTEITLRPGMVKPSYMNPHFHPFWVIDCATCRHYKEKKNDNK